MMRTLVLVLAMMVVVMGAATAETATMDVYSGWTMISAPLVPINPDPLNVFADAPSGIDGILYRWDPSSGGIGYDSLDPTLFGNVLLGDGFWLAAGSHATISYTGVPDGVPDMVAGVPVPGTMTDMWISLPGNQNDGVDAGGMHQIGQPFNHVTPVDSGAGVGDKIFFTDGTTLKNWSEAVTAGWVDFKMSGFSPALGGGFDVQYDGLGGDDSLRPGYGYWLQTGKDNIAMIIPAY